MCAPLPTSLLRKSQNHLTQVTDPLGAATRYEYDAAGRAIRETFADGTEYRFTYTVSGNQVMETRIVKPRGTVEVQRYNGQGSPSSGHATVDIIRCDKLQIVSIYRTGG